MKLLVPGGAGFLGSTLCEQLLNQGHEVICLDNFSTGNKSNIETLLANPKFSLIQHDIIDPIQIKVDGIFNLACPASPVSYQSDPIQTLSSNVLGAMNLLKLATSNNARILQASTSEIYGDPSISPQKEDYWGNVNPIGIRSCYDEGKRAAETLFMDFNRQLGTDVRIARIFNTFGPGMALNDGRVVSNFIHQSLTNKTLTIYGNGQQVRSFCYVDDLIVGLVKLFFYGEFPGPVNLGNPVPITMLELASEIKSLTNSESQIEFKPLPGDDPTTREPDISKARRLLGWEPQVSRTEGLTRTIKEFRTRLKNGGD
jgi:UDP-glucuronate decarboxylase